MYKQEVLLQNKSLYLQNKHYCNLLALRSLYKPVLLLVRLWRFVPSMPITDDMSHW